MNTTDLERLQEENRSLQEKIRILELERSLKDDFSQASMLSQLLIDELSALVFIKDVQDGFKYIIVNEEYCRVLCAMREEIIGKDDFQLFSPEDAKKYREQDERVRIEKSITVIDDVPQPDGTTAAACLTKKYIKTTSQKEYIVCISNYISKDFEKETGLRKAIEHEKEASDMMTAIFQELPSAILIKDIDDGYRFYLVNRKFEQMLNISEKDLIGKTDFDIFPQEEALKYREDDTYSSQFTKQNPNIINEVVCSPDRKSATYLKTSKFSITYRNRRLLICVGIDMTEHFNITNELRKTIKKVQEAERLKNLFIANMSHEIRTPLNAIVGFSQLLIDAQSKDEKDEYNKIINYNNDLLLSLINDILSLSLIESGTVDIKEEAFDLSDMINRITAMKAAKINNPNVELINNNTFSELIIKSDELKISQILNNIIGNAIKFTNDGYVRISLSIVSNGIEVKVEDTGIGIKTEDKARIFKRFEKVNPYIQGTGLGLSICKTLTKKLGGKIKVDSAFGKGSTFTFKLPCTIISHQRSYHYIKQGGT